MSYFYVLNRKMEISVLLATLGVFLCVKETASYGVCGGKHLIQVSGTVTWEMETVHFKAQVSVEPVANELDTLDITVMDITFDNSTEIYANLSSEIRLPVRIVKGDSSLETAYNINDPPPSVRLKQSIIDLLYSTQSTLFQNKTEDNPNFKLIEDTLALLNEGHENIILSDKYKEVILVLGNTGAGKSTFTHWIAEDSNRLKSKEVIEGLGEYIIEDSLNKIGNSTIDSKTIFPEFVLDLESDTAFYDFPGFSDTRDSSYDIATSYFIKKTIDHVEAVKMIFMINYPSVRKGVDRQDLIALLKYSTDVVRDIDKFRNSIAMIVTKVDNQYIIGPKEVTMIDDDKIINGIALCLQEVRHDIEQRASINTTDTMFYKNAIKFIDVFLTKDKGKYTRIGLFRRPDDEGPLSNIKILQKEKMVIKNLLNNELSFKQKSDGDIGRTISERSKNNIKSVIEDVDKEMLFSFCELAQQTRKSYLKILNSADDELKTFDVNNLTDINLRLLEFDKALQQLDAINSGVNKFVNNIKHTDVEKISVIILNSTLDVGIEPVNSDILTNIKKQSYYLEVLENASQISHNASLSTLVWASTFENIVFNLTFTIDRFKFNIQDLKFKIDKIIKQNVVTFGSELLKSITMIEENINVEKILKTIKEKRKHFSSKFGRANFKNINDIHDMAIEMNVSFPKGIEYKDEYSQLVEHHILNFLKYIDNAEVWYSYLIDLYKTMATYKFQRKINNLKKLISNISVLSAGKSINDTLPNEIVEENNQRYNKLFENFTLNQIQISHLQRLVSVSLQKPDHICESNGKLLIKGLNVKLSDVSRMTCGENIKFIEILALNKVFFDISRFDKTGTNINMAIVAPTWDVQNVCEIVLDGSDNYDYQNQASFGYFGGADGSDGKPGLPGGSAGHFYGIGQTFMQSFGLSISANGGDGQRGQDGGNGARGADGTTPYIGDPKSYLKSHGLYNDDSAYDWHWVYTEWKVYGDRCSRGGNGGKGGHGGRGGYPGTITIKALGDTPWIETSSKPGNFGRNGESGEPGRSGRPGTLVKISWAPFRFWDSTRVEYESLNWCNTGTKPSTLNSVGLKRAISNHGLNEDSVKNDYRQFFEQSLNDLPIVSPTKEFVSNI